jgi:hypothetical protein
LFGELFFILLDSFIYFLFYQSIALGVNRKSERKHLAQSFGPGE